MNSLRFSVRRLYAATRVATKPSGTMRIRGGHRGGDVRISANMESDIATVLASRAGTPLDLSAAASITPPEGGADIELCDTDGADFDIGVPASFNIDVARSGRRSNVAIGGWIEGDLTVRADGGGDVSVETVRGKATTLSTKHGSINVELIDGDADLYTAHGDIDIKKTQGRVLSAEAKGGGGITGKALYCDEANISAGTRGVNLQFLTAKKALVECSDGGDIRIGSVDGFLHARATDGGAIQVQLTNMARGIELEADGDIDLLVPVHLRFDARARAPRIEIDDAFAASVASDKMHGEGEREVLLKGLVPTQAEVSSGSDPERAPKAVRLRRRNSDPDGEDQELASAGEGPKIEAISTGGTVRIIQRSWVQGVLASHGSMQ